MGTKVNAMCSGDGKDDGKGDGKDDGKGDGKGDGKDDGKDDKKCAAIADISKALMEFTKLTAVDADTLKSFCEPMKSADKQTLELVASCHPDAFLKARLKCSGDGKGDGKSGAGGLRIRSPHATIELGGDVKLFRAGAKALTVDAAVNVQGSVSAKSVKIGGVPLDDYIRKKVKELLEKEK